MASSPFSKHPAGAVARAADEDGRSPMPVALGHAHYGRTEPAFAGASTGSRPPRLRGGAWGVSPAAELVRAPGRGGRAAITTTGRCARPFPRSAARSRRRSSVHRRAEPGRAQEPSCRGRRLHSSVAAPGTQLPTRDKSDHFDPLAPSHLVRFGQGIQPECRIRRATSGCPDPYEVETSKKVDHLRLN